jgi:hypothetical protein
MHSMFTPVDTFDASTYAYAVYYLSNNPTSPQLAPNTEAFREQMVLPITGLEFNGKPVTSPGFGSNYGLFLTIDDTGITGPTGINATASLYTGLNVTLWADPQNDLGTPHVSVNGGLTFSDANDIVLATGTLFSATTSLDQATGTRTDTYAETMTPTLQGTQLLDGSLPAGSHLTETLTTPSSAYQEWPTPDFSYLATTTGGSATITSDAGAILIPSESLQLSEGARFIHHHHHHP